MAGFDDRVEVTYRLDDKPAKRKWFGESTDHKALGLWGGGNAIPFLKEIMAGQKLLVRATPWSDNAVTGEFSIIGLDEAIKPLRKACGW
jgi:type VI secretion system protein VasI